jgi:prepilin-type N-terminal cleavage/methylation domain-containing protein
MFKKVLNSNKGFTLLEVMVVFSITLIMFNVLALTITNNEKRHLNRAALQIQRDLRLAQRLAIINGAEYQVNFNVLQNLYTIRVRDNEVFGGFRPIKTVNIENNINLYQVIIGNNLSSVSYTPLGTAASGGGTITLKSQNYLVRLTINIGSGRVAIQDIENRKL